MARIVGGDAPAARDEFSGSMAASHFQQCFTAEHMASHAALDDPCLHGPICESPAGSFQFLHLSDEQSALVFSGTLLLISVSGV